MNEDPTHIDLFSGIGGFAMAAAWAGFRTIAFCEIDPYCQAVLKARFGAVMADTASIRRESLHEGNGSNSQGQKQASNGWERRPKQEPPGGRPRIFGDIRAFCGSEWKGAALLTGGFPCQPFSCAGKRKGKEDDRYLWPEMLRVIAEARPAWVVGENVAGIINLELDRVLSDLEAIGYSVWPLVIPAVAVDARHRRDRVWIVGSLRSEERQEQPAREKQQTIERSGRTLPNGVSRGQPECGTESKYQNTRTGNSESGRVWMPEPGICRVAHGIPNRVDRIKGLGNAIVPQVAYEILRIIRQSP